MTKAEIFAQAAIVEGRSAIRSAVGQSAPHEGPAFEGSHNCLNNIIRDYDRRRRGHWFEKSAMRFFGTKFVSGFLDVPASRVTLFLTSENPPYAPRRVSIRAYMWDTAEVETFGPFCEYTAHVAEKALDLVATALAQPDPLADLKAA